MFDGYEEEDDADDEVVVAANGIMMAIVGNDAFVAGAELGTGHQSGASWVMQRFLEMAQDLLWMEILMVRVLKMMRIGSDDYWRVMQEVSVEWEHRVSSCTY